MVLHRQDDGVGRRDESAPVDRLHNGSERDLGGERVAVVDHGLPVVAVPAVEFDAAAARQEHLAVEFHRGLAFELVAGQVGVVRRGDVVVRQRIVHVLLGRLQVLAEEGHVGRVVHEGGESVVGQQVMGPQERIALEPLDQLPGRFQRARLVLVGFHELDQVGRRYHSLGQRLGRRSCRSRNGQLDGLLLGARRHVASFEHVEHVGGHGHGPLGKEFHKVSAHAQHKVLKEARHVGEGEPLRVGLGRRQKEFAEAGRAGSRDALGYGQHIQAVTGSSAVARLARHGPFQAPIFRAGDARRGAGRQLPSATANRDGRARKAFVFAGGCCDEGDAGDGPLLLLLDGRASALHDPADLGADGDGTASNGRLGQVLLQNVPTAKEPQRVRLSRSAAGTVPAQDQ